MLDLYDAAGHGLYEKEIGDIRVGRSDVQLNVSGAPLSQLSASAVLLMELRKQEQRFYTKSLFFKKNMNLWLVKNIRLPQKFTYICDARPFDFAQGPKPAQGPVLWWLTGPSTSLRDRNPLRDRYSGG